MSGSIVDLLQFGLPDDYWETYSGKVRALKTADVAAAGRERATVGRTRGPLAVTAPSEEELAAHAAYLEALERESKGRCVWRALGDAAAAA